MDAGVVIAPEAMEAFALVKSKKARYMVCKMSEDNSTVLLVKTGTSDDYDEFLQEFPEDESRFAIYDYKATRDDGVMLAKMQAILWAPDTLPAKGRFVYAAAIQMLCDRTIGGSRFIQASETQDLDLATILERIAK